MAEMLKYHTFSIFLLMFSFVTFYLEIVSENMTFTKQSMIIHVKDVQKAMQYYKDRKYFRKKQESWNTRKKQLNFYWYLVEDFNISDICY